MSFLLEYLKHPRKVGAIAPSGKELAKTMMRPIDFETADVIVEYGPGTGAFTKMLCEKKKPETLLLLIEQNEHFYKRLVSMFKGEPNVRILNGDAKDVNRYLRQRGYAHADYIVSGLPFTSLPGVVSDGILKATKSALGAEGVFITFQYSLLKRRYFERFFGISDCLRQIKNLPPAYVFVMKNKGSSFVCRTVTNKGESYAS